jgi:hypothetical protein
VSDKGRFLEEAELRAVRHPRGDNEGGPLNLWTTREDARNIEEGMLENSIREAYRQK